MTDVTMKVKREPDQPIDLPVKVERDGVLGHFKQERTRAKVATIVDEVMETALRVARPKGLYRVSSVGAHDRDGIEIDGVRFTSRVLSANLADITTVIPHITTCGHELDELDVLPNDFMRYYCLDVIKMLIMFHASGYFLEFLRDRYSLTETTHLHPGEFADWPISEQNQLYSLFDNPEESIGVKLTATTTLQPIKSGAGILFANGNSFESCQLCLQPNCSGRRAPYSPALVKQFTE
ncbi:MAG: hypothetical protein MUO19_04910 [Dehalococcoidales bacterium]|nr:hypothetical protein [Dehalococcoidales bacterium]